MLKDKNIVLGITGGIAVYKAVEVVSRLRKAGANVHVIMSRASTEFVTPLTFRELSGNPVTVSMWDKVTQWNVEHIALAGLADLLLVVPATANIISKAAVGMADDMLTTTLLATKAPVFFSPAMNTNMYENSIVQENLAKLKKRGYHIIEPACGHLACGTDGMGRLPEPEAIVQSVMDFFARNNELRGRKVLITAAGTIEPIDPVRYIGNRSSGKMGYAVAHEALSRGAEVVLVSGPSALSADPRIRLIKIETAAQMQEAVLEEFADSDLVIKAAAVADYRSKDVAANKIKKNDEELVLVLEKNPDILLELGRRKAEHQVLVGFAAETQKLLEYAKAKLIKKNLDFIVANNVTEKGAGFNTDTNLIKLLFRDGKVESLPLQSKQQLAKIILDRAQRLMK
jgi:phosphopantothenoylcysteine decarboxylase/phosphopantothenate--cysteine ligase